MPLIPSLMADELKFRCGGRTLLTLYLRRIRYPSSSLADVNVKNTKWFKIPFPSLSKTTTGRVGTYHDGKWMFIELQDDVHLGDILR